MSTLPESDATPRTRKPANHLEALIEAIEDRGVESAFERLAPGAEVTTPAGTGASLVGLFAAFPSRRLAVRRLVGGTDWACAEVMMTAVHRAGAVGIPATQRLVRLDQLWTMRVDDGGITAIDVLWCGSRLASQLGRAIDGGVHR